jgi:hypothetical protein
MRQGDIERRLSPRSRGAGAVRTLASTGAHYCIGDVPHKHHSTCSPFPELIRATVQAERLTGG